VSLPEELVAAADDAIAAGMAPNFSRLVRMALAREVEADRARRLATQASHLDPEEETLLTREAAAVAGVAGGTPPWARVRSGDADAG